MTRHQKNVRALAWQRLQLEKACRLEGYDSHTASFGYDVGAHAALRIALTLLPARDRLKAVNEIGQLLAALDMQRGEANLSNEINPE